MIRYNITFDLMIQIYGTLLDLSRKYALADLTTSNLISTFEQQCVAVANNVEFRKRIVLM